jgi:hypothetical protein
MEMMENVIERYVTSRACKGSNNLLCAKGKKCGKRFYLIKAFVISAMCSQLRSSHPSCHENVRITTVPFVMLEIMRIQNVHKNRRRHLEERLEKDSNYHNLISHVFLRLKQETNFESHNKL